VVTTVDGLPIGDIPESENTYNELVLIQENQIVPAFILKLDKSGLGPLMKSYQREVTK